MPTVRRSTLNNALRRAWPAGAWCACILLIAVAILQVQDYGSNDTLRACRERNAQMGEVNERAETINTIISILRERGEIEEYRHRQLSGLYVSPVLLSRCNDLFPKPWPLGLVLDK
jgi:hypothetical protein